MENKILAYIMKTVNENSNYEMIYDSKKQEMKIFTNKGIHMKDFLKIKKAIIPFVKNIVVESR